jgi:hypothetical protein
MPSKENSSIKKLKKSTKGMVNGAEFREGSCLWNSVYLQMSYVLNGKKIKAFKKIHPLKLKLCRILLHYKSRNFEKFCII